MKYQTQEGSLTLEGGWIDRSMNMLASVDLPVSGSNLVISREVLPEGMTPEDYVNQQKLILKKELTGFEEITDTEETLDNRPARFLEIRWKSQGTPMDQMLMVVCHEGLMLTFTATMPGGGDDATRETLLAAMRSFRFAVPETQDHT